MTNSQNKWEYLVDIAGKSKPREDIIIIRKFGNGNINDIYPVTRDEYKRIDLQG